MNIRVIVQGTVAVAMAVGCWAFIGARVGHAQIGGGGGIAGSPQTGGIGGGSQEGGFGGGFGRPGGMGGPPQMYGGQWPNPGNPVVAITQDSSYLYVVRDSEVFKLNKADLKIVARGSLSLTVPSPFPPPRFRTNPNVPQNAPHVIPIQGTGK